MAWLIRSAASTSGAVNASCTLLVEARLRDSEDEAAEHALLAIEERCAEGRSDAARPPRA
jgi:hypothetical protein